MLTHAAGEMSRSRASSSAVASPRRLSAISARRWVAEGETCTVTMRPNCSKISVFHKLLLLNSGNLSARIETKQEPRMKVWIDQDLCIGDGL